MIDQRIIKPNPPILGRARKLPEALPPTAVIDSPASATQALQKAAAERRKAIRNSLRQERHDADGVAHGNLAPTAQAGQHGATPRVDKQVQDASGDIGYPYQRISLLMDWENAGKIDKSMRLAGERFHEIFQLACLDPLYAADMSRVGGAPGPVKHRGSIVARDEVRDALAALGRPESPASCAAWFVLGCEFSLRRWAEREGWRGRSIDQKIGAGILIGTLGTLAKHFGY